MLIVVIMFVFVFLFIIWDRINNIFGLGVKISGSMVSVKSIYIDIFFFFLFIRKWKLVCVK